MPLYAMGNQVLPCLWSLAHKMRVNRRMRRRMATLIKGHGQTPWPRWYGVFARQVYTMMQLCQKMALPEEKAVGSMISKCIQGDNCHMQVLLRAGYRLWGNKLMPHQTPSDIQWRGSKLWCSLTAGIADGTAVTQSDSIAV